MFTTNCIKPKFAIPPLYDLLVRYPYDLSHLTTIHPLFIRVSLYHLSFYVLFSSLLQACVSSHHFLTAFPILSYPITAIDTSLSDLTYNDNLVYHYAGGIALAALKRWNQAEEFFEICASSPGHMPAAIQLEALKKLLLVQLISRGKVHSYP